MGRLALFCVLLRAAAAFITTAPAECYTQPDASDYRGFLQASSGGYTCQRWDSQEPHVHSRTPSNYPSSGLVDNYCRNPDGDDTAWCFTTVGVPVNELCSLDPPQTDCSFSPASQDQLVLQPNASVVAVLGTELLAEWDPASLPGSANVRLDLYLSNGDWFMFSTETANDGQASVLLDLDTMPVSSGGYVVVVTSGMEALSVVSEAFSVSSQECYEEADATDYVGYRDTTASGETCADWNSVGEFPEEEGNYCRNPEASRSTAWCYLSDGTVAFCDVGAAVDDCSPSFSALDRFSMDLGVGMFYICFMPAVIFSVGTALAGLLSRTADGFDGTAFVSIWGITLLLSVVAFAIVVLLMALGFLLIGLVGMLAYSALLFLLLLGLQRLEIPETAHGARRRMSKFYLFRILGACFLSFATIVGHLARWLISLAFVRQSLSFVSSQVPSVDELDAIVDAALSALGPFSAMVSVAFRPAQAAVEALSSYADVVDLWTWRCGGAASLFFAAVLISGAMMLLLVVGSDVLTMFSCKLYLSMFEESAGSREAKVIAVAFLEIVLIVSLQLVLTALSGAMGATFVSFDTCDDNDWYSLLIGRTMLVLGFTATVGALLLMANGVHLFSLAGWLHRRFKHLGFTFSGEGAGITYTSSPMRNFVVKKTAIRTALKRKLSLPNTQHARRLPFLGLFLGIWREAWNVKTYCIKERAKAYGMNVHTVLFRTTALNLALVWYIIPGGVLVGKLIEYLNEFPVFVYSGGVKLDYSARRKPRRFLFAGFNALEVLLLVAMSVSPSEVLVQLAAVVIILRGAGQGALEWFTECGGSPQTTSMV